MRAAFLADWCKSFQTITFLPEQQVRGRFGPSAPASAGASEIRTGGQSGNRENAWINYLHHVIARADEVIE